MNTNLGVITAVRNSPGPVSGITYDVAVNREGQSTYTHTDVVPFNARLPDEIDGEPLECIGAAPGTACLVLDDQGIVYIIIAGIAEFPRMGTCATAPVSDAMRLLLGSMGIEGEQEGDGGPVSGTPAGGRPGTDSIPSTD